MFWLFGTELGLHYLNEDQSILTQSFVQILKFGLLSKRHRYYLLKTCKSG